MEHFLHWRVPPWEDLFARWRKARSTRSSDLRTVADIALRRIRNLSAEDLAWFESSLEDADRRWFVAALYRNDPLPRRLFDPMMLASLRDADASAVQEFVRPCCETFGSDRVDAWLTRAEAACLADSQAIAKARYKAAPTPRKRGARKS